MFSRLGDVLEDVIRTLSGSADPAADAGGLGFTGEPDHLEAIRAFCEDVQVAGNDYHARITAGQIVNLLAGRDAYDDGELLRC